MTDITNIETAAKVAVSEVVTAKSKAVAFVLDHRALIAGVVSFITGVVLGHNL